MGSFQIHNQTYSGAYAAIAGKHSCDGSELDGELDVAAMAAAAVLFEFSRLVLLNRHIFRLPVTSSSLFTFNFSLCIYLPLSVKPRSKARKSNDLYKLNQREKRKSEGSRGRILWIYKVEASMGAKTSVRSQQINSEPKPVTR